MKKIELLRAQRARFESEITKLRECLRNFERPINVLLAKDGRALDDMSIQECIQVANLLIEMHEDADE